MPSQLPSYIRPFSSGQVDFGFGFDDEEGLGVRAAGGAEFLAGFIEGVGEDGEDYAAVGAADEIEAALLLDELELRRHSRKRCTRQHRREISRCARNDGAGVGAFGSIHRIGKRIKGKLDACERKIDLYQIGTDAAERESEEVGGEFAAEGVTTESECGE